MDKLSRSERKYLRRRLYRINRKIERFLGKKAMLKTLSRSEKIDYIYATLEKDGIENKLRIAKK